MVAKSMSQHLSNPYQQTMKPFPWFHFARHPQYGFSIPLKTSRKKKTKNNNNKKQKNPRFRAAVRRLRFTVYNGFVPSLVSGSKDEWVRILWTILNVGAWGSASARFRKKSAARKNSVSPGCALETLGGSAQGTPEERKSLELLECGVWEVFPTDSTKLSRKLLGCSHRFQPPD